MTTLAFRDASGIIKYAQTTKGVGSNVDPFYLQTVAPITHPANSQALVAITTNTIALAANPLRRSAKMQNRGPDLVDYWINSTGAYGTGFSLQVGQTYEINSTNLHTEEIRATAQNGTATLVIIEGI
jgi:hypothetical protein